jgi:hypothetical protein
MYRTIINFINEYIRRPRRRLILKTKEISIESQLGLEIHRMPVDVSLK